MQLTDAGQQLATRPSPNPQLSPGWFNNAPAAAPATIVDADMLNAVMAELAQFLTLSGQTASKTNVAQVATAALMLFGLYGIDGGSSGNAYVVTPALPLPALQDGQRVLFWTSRPNTGAATLALGALGVQQILYPNGAALAPGAISAGLNEAFWNAGLAAFVTRVPQASFVTSPFPVGWARLESGLIIQWTVLNQTEQTTVTYNFPIAFPNAAFLSVAQLGFSIPLSGGQPYVGAQPISNSQFTLTCGAPSGSTGEGIYVIHLGR